MSVGGESHYCSDCIEIARGPPARPVTGGHRSVTDSCEPGSRCYGPLPTEFRARAPNMGPRCGVGSHTRRKAIAFCANIEHGPHPKSVVRAYRFHFVARHEPGAAKIGNHRNV
jgi:hypothetical protein